MKFMKSELEMIYQYAAPSKAETLDGMKETLPFIKDDLTRAIMENAICKLEKVPEPECSKLIAENKAQFMEKRDNSILLRLALAKANQSVLLGHDLMGTERFMPETKHMITLDVLNSDSPVGFPGERYRFFLSDEGYRNAKRSEQRGEIQIKSHSNVEAGKLYTDKNQPDRER